MYKIRSVVKPAKAELSTKNSDSAFLSYLTFPFSTAGFDCAAATSTVAFWSKVIQTIRELNLTFYEKFIEPIDSKG
jgi:hypothetical protein